MSEFTREFLYTIYCDASYIIEQIPEAEAILAKYGLTEGDYSYTAYKIENEYLYD